jgi:tRNA (guanine37-N1)-methyltransferase
MKFTVLSLFPEIVDTFFSASIMAKAVDRELISVNLVDIRDFAMDKHRTCDDAPYGGGAGMVLKAEPLAGALDSVGAAVKRVVYPTPSGRLFDQKMAAELAAVDELVFICGRYEGIDQRIIDLYVDDEVSIGDYVISSGEIASLVIIDAVYRLVEGVISGESLAEESFTGGLLEYPHYTRPQVFCDLPVPDIL